MKRQLIMFLAENYNGEFVQALIASLREQSVEPLRDYRKRIEDGEAEQPSDALRQALESLIDYADQEQDGDGILSSLSTAAQKIGSLIGKLPIDEKTIERLAGNEKIADELRRIYNELFGQDEDVQEVSEDDIEIDVEQTDGSVEVDEPDSDPDADSEGEAAAGEKQDEKRDGEAEDNNDSSDRAGNDDTGDERSGSRRCAENSETARPDESGPDDERSGYSGPGNYADVVDDDGKSNDGSNRTDETDGLTNFADVIQDD